MKSNSLVMAILLLGIGLGIGYSLGRWQGNATGEMPQVSTGQHQQTSGNLTASSDGPTKHKGSSNNAEAPDDTAKRLLDGLLQGKPGVSGDPVERIRFQQALAQCDEGTVLGLIDKTREIAAKDPIMFFLDNPEAKAWGQLMVERMATKDPMKGLDAILALKVALFSFMHEDLELIFANLSQQDPAQIPAALARMEANGIKSGKRAWMLTLAKTDPEAVFQYLIRHEYTAPIDEDDFEAISKRLGLYAPEKALAAIQKYDGKGNLDKLSKEVMDAWCASTPADAFSHALSQKNATLLLSCLNNPFFDANASRQAFPELKSSNPEARITLAARLAIDLAGQDVKAAREWAATLPPAEQAGANRFIAEEWIDQDPVAASEWLATWPAGKAKESAARELIHKIEKNDPERALTWATNCLQGQSRYSALAGIMESLAAKDPSTAAAARAALSEEDRTLLNFTEKYSIEDSFCPSHVHHNMVEF